MRKARLVLVAATVVALFATVGTARAENSGSATVKCNDGTVTYSPTTLWPPDHKMQTITISYTDNDNDGDNASVMIGAITDNQSAKDGTDELVGSGAPTSQQGLDWAGTGNHASATDPKTATTTAQVRAERSGTAAEGRTYDIKVTCADQGGSNNEMEMQTIDAFIHVPHDMGR
ncbi:MAG: hypothetical protein ACYDCC_06965 [Actinomycetota bacterium]